jgi:hypothetical protein
MNWRRGLLLAGINLVVAAISFIQVEANTWQWIRSSSTGAASAHVQVAAFQEEQMLSNPCDFGIWDNGYTPLSLVAGGASLPVSLATGWHTPCNPNRSMIAKSVQVVFGRNTRRGEVVIVSIVCLLVFAMWLAIGGMPLTHVGSRWLEPGAVITLCTLVGFALAFAPYAELCRGTAFAACIGWVWWLGLILWRIGCLAWQSTLGGLRRLSN